MSERAGLHSVLERSSVYRWFQTGIGRGDTSERILGELFPEVRTGPVAVLDAGCGPGAFMTHHRNDAHEGVPSRYVGFDPNPEYIARASALHPDVVFRTGTTETLPDIDGPFDLAVALGVLHHVDDRIAHELVRFVHARLRPGGRFVTLDPVLLPRQRRIARFLARADRGMHVRDVAGYSDLVSEVFGVTATSTTSFDDLLRVPYDHLAVVAVR